MASVEIADSTNNEDEAQENVVELEEDWGEEYNDVVMFLCGLHLNEYIEMFVNQGITLDIFLHLSEEDLCHIGMTDSKHRATLLEGVAKLKQNKTKAAEEVQLGNLRSEEVNAILASTVKHLTVMHAALAHLRLNLRSPDVHNTLVTLTLTSAELLETLTAEADIQAQLLLNQINAVLLKKPGAVQPASKLKWKTSLMTMSSLVVVLGLTGIFVAKKLF
ncbi:uncharacterized protein LOC128992576 [Macrosteles quadrilineatus]|uniref:uncharacterized protein LOC128992576 n=1 Tax=Macrosteles quadrilineatus TaxID=74068 RepID=UPI0023E2713B|nr:uncharacterized protein LOC128992576 [Macrosteles quadrilineatus]XP_054272196.1 uncharacterized protein LOC128992576 [Macrosteles quadrilineatus]XP_054272197.1 uncharacterized protein LOC128992576 [Macrosteles quadrilineatus]